MNDILFLHSMLAAGRSSGHGLDKIRNLFIPKPSFSSFSLVMLADVVIRGANQSMNRPGAIKHAA